jgi:effector-binding domain-containing protein
MMPFIVVEGPTEVWRDEQPYVAIAASVTMEEIGTVLPPLHPEVRAWLSARGVEPSGAPFFKYDVIDMDHLLDIEVGFPVSSVAESDGRVNASTLPSGSYVVAQYECHPRFLIEATASHLRWADEHDIEWDATAVEGGDRWAARLESYVSNPPNMDHWVTELAFRVADVS